MINLLPDSDKKNNDQEYRLRRMALVVFLLIVVVLSSMAFMTPSYVLSRYRASGEKDGLANQTSESQGGNEKDLEFQINTAKNLTTLLKPDVYTKPSEIINFIAKDKTENNTISAINYNRVLNAKASSTVVSVGVSGLAKTRQSLVAFTEALGRETGIEKVDVPVSNFAKDSNINFTFTIVTSEK